MSTVNAEFPDEVSEQTRAILALRAERLRAPLVREADQERMLWVATFTLGDEVFAFALGALKAAMPLRMVTPVPLAPPHVLGVLRFQGEIIAALSLASLLGDRAWRVDPSILLVLEVPGAHAVAVDCSEVPMSIGLPLDAVEAAEARAAREAPESPAPILDVAFTEAPTARARMDRAAPQTPARNVRLIHLDRLFDPAARGGRRGR